MWPLVISRFLEGSSLGAGSVDSGVGSFDGALLSVVPSVLPLEPPSVALSLPLVGGVADDESSVATLKRRTAFFAVLPSFSATVTPTSYVPG